MASVNKVILIGNLGAAPDLKYLPSGQAVCELRLACNETWLDKAGQKQERTEWVRVTVWGKRAESCGKYLEKGKQVYVEGSLRTESWDDKETGEKKYATKVQAQNVVFLGGKGGRGASDEGGEDGGDTQRQASGGGGRQPARDHGGPAPQQPPDYGPGDDDIPF